MAINIANNKIRNAKLQFSILLHKLVQTENNLSNPKEIHSLTDKQIKNHWDKKNLDSANDKDQSAENNPSISRLHSQLKPNKKMIANFNIRSTNYQNLINAHASLGVTHNESQKDGSKTISNVQLSDANQTKNDLDMRPSPNQPTDASAMHEVSNVQTLGNQNFIFADNSNVDLAPSAIESSYVVDNGDQSSASDSVQFSDDGAQSLRAEGEQFVQNQSMKDFITPEVFANNPDMMSTELSDMIYHNKLQHTDSASNSIESGSVIDNDNSSADHLTESNQFNFTSEFEVYNKSPIDSSSQNNQDTVTDNLTSGVALSESIEQVNKIDLSEKNDTLREPTNPINVDERTREEREIQENTEIEKEYFDQLNKALKFVAENEDLAEEEEMIRINLEASEKNKIIWATFFALLAEKELKWIKDELNRVLEAAKENSSKEWQEYLDRCLEHLKSMIELHTAIVRDAIYNNVPEIMELFKQFSLDEDLRKQMNEIAIALYECRNNQEVTQALNDFVAVLIKAKSIIEQQYPAESRTHELNAIFARIDALMAKLELALHSQDMINIAKMIEEEIINLRREGQNNTARIIHSLECMDALINNNNESAALKVQVVENTPELAKPIESFDNKKAETIKQIEKTKDTAVKTISKEITVEANIVELDETVDKHVETVDKHVETVDKHVETVDKHVETVDKHVETVEEHEKYDLAEESTASTKSAVDFDNLDDLDDEEPAPPGGPSIR